LCLERRLTGFYIYGYGRKRRTCQAATFDTEKIARARRFLSYVVDTEGDELETLGQQLVMEEDAFA